jgi:hypothetical protein
MLWLLFRLMFGSGAVKLASGDPTWRDLTALTYHFETQPIPTPVAWYAHWLPVWAQKVSTAAVLGAELIAPLFILGPRRPRIVAFWILVTLQGLIALTGNYAFFNLLTVALCLFLLDDAALERVLRGSRPVTSLRQGDGGPPKFHARADAVDHRRVHVRRALVIAVAVVTVPVSALYFTGSLGIALPGRSSLAPLAGAIAPFRSVGSYGLFAVMTTTRPEIVIEGSHDGVTWRSYEFKYKVGDMKRAPPWVAPHQPRLDWQMWFAALGRYEDEPWFQNLCLRLLEGSPTVVRLLERDPFDGQPPRFVRASLYRYRFADATSRRKDGVWWTRERLGDYSPVLSLAAGTSGEYTQSHGRRGQG